MDNNSNSSNNPAVGTVVTLKVAGANINDLGTDITDFGVYKNSRLMHTVTSLIGCLVEVELTDGERYEGIFKTFSPEVCVEYFWSYL